ncbi:MAG: hypothetical protein LKJ21_10050 [Oscillospiraceae bacterium]|jgi:hypothetical protein|nr:hypothetical protein [Oscillospiraceae bacterium]MCI1991210.1 hypothetical protein [Oscillospiraceae bacterium]MCI2036215.1 hypothetical protein [Oscillospiraceae bacterium]
MSRLAARERAKGIRRKSIVQSDQFESWVIHNAVKPYTGPKEIPAAFRGRFGSLPDSVGFTCGVRFADIPGAGTKAGRCVFFCFETGAVHGIVRAPGSVLRRVQNGGKSGKK